MSLLSGRGMPASTFQQVPQMVQSLAPSVTVVLVTFNRQRLLLECVEAVLGQTQAIERLLIIDNASTDGTRERLREAGYLAHPKVDYHRLTENTGGAGGFRFGMGRALSDTGAGWIWVMDDDVAPRADCLEMLLGYRHISECIHPLVVYEDGTEHEWEHLLDPGSTCQIGLGNRSFKHGKDWCLVNAACFEGMLASRRVVEAVGLPREEFFVSGDDNLFGYLAGAHTNVIYVRRAVLVKKIKPSKDRSPFKIYYDVRNRFLIRKILKVHFRSTPYGPISFAVFIFLYALNIIQRPFRYDKARAVALALFDGMRGAYGRLRY